jgi:DNA replication protein DnaC
MAQSGLTNKDNKPDAAQCSKCDDTIEYVWRTHGGFSYWSKPSCKTCETNEQKEKKRLDVDRRLRSSRVPKMLQGLRPDQLTVDSDNEHVNLIVNKWEAPAWVVVSGPVGTGKTTWLTALFNQLVECGVYGSAIWTTESELFETCDIAHAADGYTGRQTALRRFVTTPLLMLDDAGAGRPKLTEWQLASMRHLFDVRHSNGLPTFITTNLANPDAFAARYGKHVTSRVLHAATKFTYLCGKDRRLV